MRPLSLMTGGSFYSRRPCKVLGALPLNSNSLLSARKLYASPVSSLLYLDPHPGGGEIGVSRTSEFPLGRGRRSQNLFICSSLSLHIPLPHTPLADRSPSTQGGRKWGPTAGCVSPRSASLRRFNEAVVPCRRSVRAAVGRGPHFWVDPPQFTPRRWESCLVMLVDNGALASAPSLSGGARPVGAQVVGFPMTPLS